MNGSTSTENVGFSGCFSVSVSEDSLYSFSGIKLTSFITSSET
jgi:hypothetical protein